MQELNRPENILLASPGCDLYKVAYGRRSDSENANGQSDEALHRQKARSLGGLNQALDRWGHGFIQTA